MTTTHNQTLNLLKQLKHKRFNSQLDTTAYNNEPTPHRSSTSNSNNTHNQQVGFTCSYHPTQVITNFCITQPHHPKPLCPRCLQQHMNSHQERSTMCKLQTCKIEMERVSAELEQKVQACNVIKNKMDNLNIWRSQYLTQARSQLQQYRQQVHTSVNNTFDNLATELQKKHQQNFTLYQKISQQLQQSLLYLEINCQKQLQSIFECKELHSIVLVLPEIEKRFKQLVNGEKRMVDEGVRKVEVMFDKGKFGEVVKGVRGLVQYRVGRMSEGWVDSVGNMKQKKGAIVQCVGEENAVDKLQRLYQNNPQGKLCMINSVKRQQHDEQSRKHQKLEKISTVIPVSPRSILPFKTDENTNSSSVQKQTILDRLNDTTNRLKDSLNGFASRGNKKVY